MEMLPSLNVGYAERGANATRWPRPRFLHGRPGLSRLTAARSTWTMSLQVVFRHLPRREPC